MASSAMAASASATYAGAALTHRRASVRASRGTTVVVRAAEEKFDARAFRRELSKSPKYNRKFEKDQESAAAMETAGIGMVSKGASARVTISKFRRIRHLRDPLPDLTRDPSLPADIKRDEEDPDEEIRKILKTFDMTSVRDVALKIPRGGCALQPSHLAEEDWMDCALNFNFALRPRQPR